MSCLRNPPKLVASAGIELLRSAAREVDGTTHGWCGVVTENGARRGHAKEGGQPGEEGAKEHCAQVWTIRRLWVKITTIERR